MRENPVPVNVLYTQNFPIPSHREIAEMTTILDEKFGDNRTKSVFDKRPIQPSKKLLTNLYIKLKGSRETGLGVFLSGVRTPF